MGIFNKLWNQNINNQITYSLQDEEFLKILGLDGIVAGDRIGEATYFRALKILSETLAKLPLKIYKETSNGNEKIKHYLNYLLKTQPNPYMNANTFWSTVEFNRNHQGNSYVYIERRKGKVEALWILPSASVQILVDDNGILGVRDGIYYKYIDSRNNKQYIFRKDEILHFKSWITVNGEGVVGLSVQDILRNYIDKGLYANDFITKLTQNGMMTDKIIIQYTGSLDSKAEKALIEHMESFNSNGSGKYITMPLGLSVQNLSSKLVDSQFFELNKYNAIQIGMALGISPQQLGDWEKGNFANAGIQQEMFYKDTLLPILSNYEQELAIKLFTKREKEDNYYFNFNVDAILRSAFKERIETYAQAVQNGILTANECRSLENRAGLEGGDDLVVNGNIMKLKDASIQYQKNGGENNS